PRGPSRNRSAAPEQPRDGPFHFAASPNHKEIHQMDAYTEAALGSRATPQTQAADPRQVKNNAGGFTFTLDPLAQARRFLILGSDAPTFYQNARELTAENAAVILSLVSDAELGP